MPGQHVIELEAIVVEVLPRGVFQVALANGHRLVAWPGRNARSWSTKLTRGDRVAVEVSPFDFSSARLRSRVESGQE